jgi:hypothetical protein
MRRFKQENAPRYGECNDDVHVIFTVFDKLSVLIFSVRRLPFHNLHRFFSVSLDHSSTLNSLGSACVMAPGGVAHIPADCGCAKIQPAMG